MIWSVLEAQAVHGKLEKGEMHEVSADWKVARNCLTLQNRRYFLTPDGATHADFALTSTRFGYSGMLLAEHLRPSVVPYLQPAVEPRVPQGFNVKEFGRSVYTSDATFLSAPAPIRTRRVASPADAPPPPHAMCSQRLCDFRDNPSYAASTRKQYEENYASMSTVERGMWLYQVMNGNSGLRAK